MIEDYSLKEFFIQKFLYHKYTPIATTAISNHLGAYT